MPKVTLELEVPSHTCGKCGVEQVSKPILQRMPTGHIVLGYDTGMTQFLFGQMRAMLCANCLRFITGALVAMGIQWEEQEEQKPKGVPLPSS